METNSAIEAEADPSNEALHSWQNPRVLRKYRLRRFTETIMVILATLSVALILYPLLDIMSVFVYRGALAVTISRLTMTTDQGLGLANAVVGTFMLVGLSGLVAIPIGVLGGIYLAEFAPHGRYAEMIRFVADVLAGLPSILLGYLGFLILTLYFGWGVGSGGSLLAGALVLSVLMLPYILRTTELSLKKVPQSLREAATALGSTKSQMINRLTFSLALPGIITGIILSLSISIGETAPLLITVGNSGTYSLCLTNCATSYLTYVIWEVVQSANSAPVDLAYLSAFLLMAFIVGLNIVARVGLRRFSKI